MTSASSTNHSASKRLPAFPQAHFNDNTAVNSPSSNTSASIPQPSPSSNRPSSAHSTQRQPSRPPTEEVFGFESDFDDWDDDNDKDNDTDMPSDLRPPFHRPTDGKSQTPLLNSSRSNSGHDDALTRPSLVQRKSSVFHERDPDVSTKEATRQRYIYATFFLVLSLFSFVIQTETAVYIQHNLHWNKAYCML